MDIKKDSWIHSVNPGLRVSGLDLINIESRGEKQKAQKQIIDKIKNPDKPIGQLITDYAHIRETLKQERALFREKEQELKNDLEKIEVQILKVQRDMGVRSISTKDFTAYQSTKSIVRMSNWDVFSKWVLETGNLQCIEKRPAKLACLEIEEHFKQQAKEEGKESKTLEDIGLESFSEIVVNIRKK